MWLLEPGTRLGGERDDKELASIRMTKSGLAAGFTANMKLEAVQPLQLQASRTTAVFLG